MNKDFNFLLYQSAEENVSVNAIIKDETIWLTQKAMGELFGVESNTITYHLKEIYKSEELQENSTARKIRVVQKEGNRVVERELQFYNLDAIISVGYRVNSKRATNFRIWATNIININTLHLTSIKKLQNCWIKMSKPQNPDFVTPTYLSGF